MQLLLLVIGMHTPSCLYLLSEQHYRKEFKEDEAAGYVNGPMAILDTEIIAVYPAMVDEVYAEYIDFSLYENICAYLVMVDLSVSVSTVAIQEGYNLQYFIICDEDGETKIMVPTVPIELIISKHLEAVGGDTKLANDIINYRYLVIVDK